MTIVPCGVTEFDKTAYIYWGRHKAQENNRANINHYEKFYIFETFNNKK